MRMPCLPVRPAADAALALTGACARGPAALAPLPLRADSVATTAVADGVRLHRLRFAAGPQVAHVLEVDRAACWTLRAHKTGDGAVGRAGALALARALAAAGADVAGGVNADFFLFAPPGVPQGAHVADGLVVAGPAARPVLALDSAGGVFMGELRAEGEVRAGAATLPLDAWNRGSARGVALFDRAWGERTDSLPGRVLVRLRLLGDARAASLAGVVEAVDSGSVAVLADGVAVLAAGAAAPAS
ncbi:hypothetical protein PYV61_12820, partial [Roseisolibacter sp. H3M3-2]